MLKHLLKHLHTLHLVFCLSSLNVQDEDPRNVIERRKENQSLRFHNGLAISLLHHHQPKYPRTQISKYPNIRAEVVWPLATYWLACSGPLWADISCNECRLSRQTMLVSHQPPAIHTLKKIVILHFAFPWENSWASAYAYLSLSVPRYLGFFLCMYCMWGEGVYWNGCLLTGGMTWGKCPSVCRSFFPYRYM